MDEADGRRSSIRHFSLMNSLLAVLNTSDHDSTDNVLARFFLKHFDQLDQLNVYDVAEECYTSRSGIRRFCQSIGLDNFSDLKSYTWEWGRHRNQFVSYASHDGYRAHLSSAIDQTIRQVNRVVTDDFLDDFACLLHDAERVVILTSDFSSMSIRQFQQSMLYFRKIVHIITDSTGDVAQLETLDAHDALVVVSEHGNYARAVQSALPASRVPRVLVTVDAPNELVATFDYALRLSSEAKAPGRTAYAQYGLTYVFDLLYNRYFELFNQG